MKLKFSVKDLDYWAGQYNYPKGDDEPTRIGEWAREKGYLTKAQFVALAAWKSERPRRRHERNSENVIREVTRFALATRVEPLPLTSLQLLGGVQARTASAILHFCHRRPYPIMDVRAVWSLGIDKAPSDWVAFWPEYVRACRKLSKEGQVSMRVLDRALWAYSSSQGQVAR